MAMNNNMELYNKINIALDKMRPHFKIDSGNIEIIEITDDKVVKLRWLGSCSKCGRSEIAFNYSVREYLLSEFIELKDVIEI
jgi:Fe-S cluster biogenesis protein NfuA